MLEQRMGVEEGQFQCPIPQIWKLPQAVLQMCLKMMCQQAQDWGTKILGVKGGKIWGERPQSMAVFGKIRCSFSLERTLCGSNVSGEKTGQTMQDWSGEGRQWRV